jgi:hypothetical protein
LIGELLDAECVLRRLENLEIISMREWQDRNTSDHDYSVYFDNPRKPGDVRLQIVKRKERCYIPRSIINILSYRHSFNPAGIFTDCSVKPA